MTPQKFLATYHKQTEQLKALMRLKALLYFKVPVETWRECFYNLAYLFPKKTPLPVLEFNALTEQLKTRKLLNRDNDLPLEFAHVLTLDALNSEYAHQYLQALEAAATKIKNRFYSSWSLGEDAAVNRFRLSLYKRDETAYTEFVKTHPSSEVTQLLQQFFLPEPLEISWLKTQFKDVQWSILSSKLMSFYLRGSLKDQIPSLLNAYLPLRETETSRSFQQAFLLHDIYTGQLKKAAQTLDSFAEQTPLITALRGVIAFLEDKNEEALLYFETALKNLRKLVNKKKVLFGTQETLFYALALFKTANRENYPKLQTLLSLASQGNPNHSNVFTFLEKVLLKLKGLESQVMAKDFESYLFIDPLSKAMATLAAYWLDEKIISVEKCREEFHRYQTLSPLVAKVFAEILQRLDLSHQKDYEQYLEREAFKGQVRFIDCVHMGEEWERALNNLDHFFDRQGLGISLTAKRLAWYLHPQRKQVEVLEQTLQAKGGWSKGKAVSLKRLYEKDPKLDYLTEEDKKVIKTLQSSRYGWSNSYEWDNLKTPLALIGHPCVYHAQQQDVRLDLVQGEVELRIKQKESGHFHLSLSPVAFSATTYLEQETPSRYRVIEFPESLVPLVDILGVKGIKVPTKAKDQLVSLIQKASPLLSIHSEVDVMDHVPAQEGDATPCLQIIPLKEGLKLSLWVRPFENQGPYLRPGQGQSPLLVFLEGKPFKADRSLAKEEKRAEELIHLCPSLQRLQERSHEWILEDPEECLEVLSELQALASSSSPITSSDSPQSLFETTRLCRLEWPEGQKLFVTPSSSFEHLSLKITQDRDWLSVQGEFKVDEETVLGFEKLLELLDQTKGRFIPLQDNKFLALSSHFKKHLEDLKAMSEKTATGYRLPALGGLALKAFADKVENVEGDSQWKEKLMAFKKAETYQPQLPTTLQADLRDYQREGFEWISRLAFLGMGMCLADDMGLGKTLQAIAVLLTQAPQGPCLVIAPTSVCYNWIAEIAKFAPTLVCHSFNETSKREELVTSLQAMDVLIASYALLQQEEELLTSRKWQMIVLDEAQAIKNASTKRFQAAIQLQGEVKLALTGTPVENHLEEIWSLFRFIAPGLLGSREGFQKRFLALSEKDKTKGQDKSIRRGLKNLIQFFILRRTKNAVLQELPSRTEQTILIEMSPEETSFYEALRRQALTNIANLAEKKGQRKIHILAEITRLRRACCHPSLVNTDVFLNSSKVKVFLELVEDLLENNHQALVFSQYVGYLTLIREALDQKGIAYQYLDGSTPAVERKKQVQAFQEGKSSLFLLTLKAGGTGLNLTAADYVIHLDPWWNPAVEDQASDRAHRLGQQRPVTIYRLIMQHSIEEKIVELHQHKREMVSELLEGSDVPTKMSEEALLELIATP